MNIKSMRTILMILLLVCFGNVLAVLKKPVIIDAIYIQIGEIGHVQGDATDIFAYQCYSTRVKNSCTINTSTVPKEDQKNAFMYIQWGCLKDGIYRLNPFNQPAHAGYRTVHFPNQSTFTCK